MNSPQPLSTPPAPRAESGLREAAALFYKRMHDHFGALDYESSPHDENCVVCREWVASGMPFLRSSAATDERDGLLERIEALPTHERIEWGPGPGEGRLVDALVSRNDVLAALSPDERQPFAARRADARKRVRDELAERCVDLMYAVELADTRTGVAEERDGMVEVYTLRASDWNRVVAVARGHMSQKARRSIDNFRRKLECDGTDWLRQNVTKEPATRPEEG